MESLENTLWDVVIAGTGLQQSLLALALSRSGKRVLHLDKNSFYGGSSAAFSLTEAEEWVKSLAKDPSPSPFTDVLIHQLPQPSSNNNDAPPKLSHSRDYTLTLSPQIIYCRSELLTALLTSQVYKQLQFQAVGSYWLYSPEDQDSAIKDNAGQINGKQSAANRIGNFQRVPNGREDIFADKSIDLKSKGALTKFLRFVRQYKDAGKQVIWRPYAETSFTEFLSSQFNLPPALHNPLLSLTLTPYPPAHTTTQFALPRIARHLESIGVYGPGFASLVQKYGTAAEISQIACRAAAVGGATYLLNQGIQGLGEVTNQESNDGTHASLHNLQQVHLAQGPTLRAKWVVGSTSDIPSTALSSFSSKAATSGHCEESVLRSISILSSPLPSLFVDLSEGGPTPAGAIIMIPSGSLPALNHDQASFDLPPVYLIAHSSDTGECPSKHCILFASILDSPLSDFAILGRTIKCFLDNFDQSERPSILHTIQYRQSGIIPQTNAELNEEIPSSFHGCQQNKTTQTRNIRVFPLSSLDLVLDGTCLHNVRDFWGDITCEESKDSEFMVFSNQ